MKTTLLAILASASLLSCGSLTFDSAQGTALQVGDAGKRYITAAQIIEHDLDDSELDELEQAGWIIEGR